MDGQPNVLVWVALVVYVPVVFLLYSKYGPFRGMLLAALLGWLFLPWFDTAVGSSVPLLHKKSTYLPAVLLLASAALDLRRLTRVRPALLDLPVLVFLVAWTQSSLTNGEGLYDAGSALLEAGLSLGVPYLLGRAYGAGQGALDEMADLWVKGGLIYVPVCLWEVRMSPQLHRQIYGYHQHEFIMHFRYGSYRPMGFMYSGLMIGLFMACSTLVAYWLWRTRARKQIWGVPMVWVVLALAFTTVACKAVGAILLLALAIGVFEVVRRARKGLLVVVLALLPALYCSARIIGWNGQTLVDMAAAHIDRDRASSLHDRIVNEDLIVQHGMQRPVTGWGTQKFQLYDDTGKLITVTDGLWIILLGVSGVFGLIALLAHLALPSLALLRRFPAAAWVHPALAPAAALSVVLLLSALDSLFNDMRMPFFPLSAGTVVSFLLANRRRGRRRAAGTAGVEGGSPRVRPGPAEPPGGAAPGGAAARSQ